MAKQQIWVQQWFRQMERMQIWLLSRPHFKTLISEMGIENAKRVPFKTPFQDPISRPLCTYNEESLVVSDHELLEQPQEDLAAENQRLISRPLRSTGYESAVKSTLMRVITRPQPMVHEVVESNRDKSWLLSRPQYMSKIEIWSEIEVDRVISRPWVSLEQRWVEIWLLSRPQMLHVEPAEFISRPSMIGLRQGEWIATHY